RVARRNALSDKAARALNHTMTEQLGLRINHRIQPLRREAHQFRYVRTAPAMQDVPGCLEAHTVVFSGSRDPLSTAVTIWSTTRNRAARFPNCILWERRLERITNLVFTSSTVLSMISRPVSAKYRSTAPVGPRKIL